MAKTTTPKLGELPIGDDFKLNLDYYLGSAYDDIGVASTELPPVVEWVNEQLQQMVEQKYTTSQKIKVVEAEAYFRLKGGGFEERGYAGRPTEDAIKHAVALDRKVQKAHEEYAVLVGWVQRLSDLQRSLQVKLDLVRSTEATRRKVFDETPTT